jgi:hypothetical protein
MEEGWVVVWPPNPGKGLGKAPTPMAFFHDRHSHTTIPGPSSIEEEGR